MTYWHNIEIKFEYSYTIPYFEYLYNMVTSDCEDLIFDSMVGGNRLFFVCNLQRGGKLRGKTHRYNSLIVKDFAGYYNTAQRMISSI